MQETISRNKAAKLLASEGQYTTGKEKMVLAIRMERKLTKMEVGEKFFSEKGLTIKKISDKEFAVS